MELRKILLPDVGHQIVRRWRWGGELRADLENVLMEEEHFGCEAMEMSFWGGRRSRVDTENVLPTEGHFDLWFEE